jgi:hypothetical protein
MPEDSGWQFLCGTKQDSDDPTTAKVWLICEVLDYEPSLAAFMERPPGTVLTRVNGRSEWEIAKK